MLHKTDSLKLSITIRDRLSRPAHSVIIIHVIIMIMISIFNEDNVFSTTTNLPYDPLMNTDNDYYRTFSLRLFSPSSAGSRIASCHLQAREWVLNTGKWSPTGFPRNTVVW